MARGAGLAAALALAQPDWSVWRLALLLAGGQPPTSLFFCFFFGTKSVRDCCIIQHWLPNGCQ